MIMQRNVFEGAPITMYAADRYADRQRQICEDLLIAATLRAASDSPWFALHVMSGREKVVESTLAKADIEVLVPMRKGPIYRRRHRIIPASDIPVLSSYVLVRCLPSAEAFAGFLRVEHVLGIVGGSERPHVVTQEEVRRFSNIAISGAYDWEASSAVFRRGEKASIKDGPFACLRGEIVTCRKDGKGDAVVLLDLFGRETPVLVPLAILEHV